MVLLAVGAFLGLLAFAIIMHGRCEEREHTRKLDIGGMKMQRSQIEHKNWVEKAQLHLDYYDKQPRRHAVGTFEREEEEDAILELIR